MKKLVLMLLMFAPLATFAQQKFGHINAQEVMSQMPEFIKARGEMEAKAKQYENDLKAMQDELQRKSQEYDNECYQTAGDRDRAQQPLPKVSAGIARQPTVIG